MLGTINPKQKEVIVAGGGIAGLLISYQLQSKGYEVSLYEASCRLGGLIRSVRSPLSIAESAAHSVLGTAQVREFFSEIQLDFLEARKEASARYIFEGGRLRRFPLGLTCLLEAFLRANFVLSVGGPKKERLTVERWVERHLGQGFLRGVFQPMVSGIYGCSPAELLLDLAFPSLTIPRGETLLSMFLRRRWANWGKSQTRPVMLCPTGGMEALVECLETRLRSEGRTKIMTSHALKSHDLASLSHKATNIVLAVPPFEAARLLESTHPVLAQALSELSYSSLICLNVLVKKACFKKIPKGVGVLMAEKERTHSLGILFHSSTFPGRVTQESEDALFSVILGGTRNPEYFEKSDQEILDFAYQDLEKIFGFKGDFKEWQLHRWSRAVPHYNWSLKKAWALSQDSWCSEPGHVLFANYTGQLSLRGLIETAGQLPKCL